MAFQEIPGDTAQKEAFCIATKAQDGDCSQGRCLENILIDSEWASEM